MGKGKLAKFADLEHYPNVFQCPYGAINSEPFALRGHWHEHFANSHPIVLELGCGKGEYTVNLARIFPDKNFIGIDIKGARLWTGATQALREGLSNVAFLRTNIELIDHFFAPDEVSELWLTFSDPQMKNPRKRLTSTYFLERYKKILIHQGIIHLKTDSSFLYTYTTHVVSLNHLPLSTSTDDLYHTEISLESLRNILHIRTYYEQMWLSRGIPIKYIEFRLPHDIPLTEPEVEIERDSYRSTHRRANPPQNYSSSED